MKINVNCISNTTKIFCIVNGHLPTYYSNKLKIEKANNIIFLAEIYKQNSIHLTNKYLTLIRREFDSVA